MKKGEINNSARNDLLAGLAQARNIFELKLICDLLDLLQEFKTDNWTVWRLL
jgi:hypothetical protein